MLRKFEEKDSGILTNKADFVERKQNQPFYITLNYDRRNVYNGRSLSGL